MGQHWNSTVGYGVLVVENDGNDFNAICEENIESDILVDVTVGDMVLGEDEGLFFMTEDVTIKMNSAVTERNEYISEFVEEFADYSVTDEIKQEADKLATGLLAKGFKIRVGAFKVSDFG